MQTSLTVQWANVTETVNEYRISTTYIGPCSDLEGSGRILSIFSGDAFQYMINNLRNFSTYSVVVTAVNSAGESRGLEKQISTLSDGK